MATLHEHQRTAPAAPDAPEGGELRTQRSVLVADVLVAVLLLGLAAALRWPALAPSSLWLDDAWVALVHRTSGWEELRFVGFAAPGFAALLKGWLQLTGFSELQAQLPAFVAGALTAPLAYLVARWRRWHPVAALLGATLLAVGPIGVTYATRVKQYTLEALLGVVLVALVLWLLDDRTDRRRWSALTLTGALGTVVSAFAAPIVAAGFAAVLVAGLRTHDAVTVRRALAWGGAYGAAALAWYLAVLAPAVTSSISGFWSGDFLVLDAGVVALLGSVIAAWAGVLAGLVPAGVPEGVPAVLLLGVAVAASALTVVVAGTGEGPVASRASDAGGRVGAGRGRDGIEVVVLLLGPLLIATVLAGLQLAPLGGGRTDHYLHTGLALLVAAGGDAGVRLARTGPPRFARVAAQGLGAVGLVAVAALVVTAAPVDDYPASDVRPLVTVMERSAAPDDALLIYPATMWAYALYTSSGIALAPDPVSSWGFSPTFADERVVTLPPGRDEPGAYLPTVEGLASSEVEVVWLLVSHWRGDVDDLRDQLDAAGFEGDEVDRRPGARLERYVRR